MIRPSVKGFLFSQHSVQVGFDLSPGAVLPVSKMADVYAVTVKGITPLEPTIQSYVFSGYI